MILTSHRKHRTARLAAQLRPSSGPAPATDKKVNKVKKVKNTNNRARAWPKDFCLTEKMRSYAINKGIVKVDAFFDDFKDWAAAKGATYKDWQAAFRTRIGKAPEYGKQFMGENQSQHDELVEVGNKWLIKNG
jgi:hypothetical protein